MIRFLVFILAAVYLQSILCTEEQSDFILVKLGENATIPLPVSANYRRIVQNADYKDEEHLYRVCNAKNKKTCGYWENVKTKKKMPSGKTVYNKNKKTLIVRGMLASDFGKYMTGNKKVSKSVLKLIVKG